MAQDDNSNRDDVERVLEIRRASIGEAEVHEEPRAALEDGQIRLRIDRFAVTANNVSYAGAGDLLGYWDFFPSSDPSTWGLPGPAPQFFFAPTELDRLVEGWGADEYRRRIVAATHEFVQASRAWMTIDERRGPDGPASAWASIYAGEVTPDVGVIASFHP